MPQKKTLLSSAFLVMLILTNNLNGTPVHALNVAALVESSDLIVSGRVTSITEQGRVTINLPSGSTPGKKLLASITADETLKGIITPNLTAQFVLPDVPSGIRGIPNAQYGIFFLKRETSGYGMSDPFYPFLPAMPDGRPSSGPPLDRVVAKLGELLTYKLSTESDLSSALNALATMPGKSATETLRHALETSSGDLRLRVGSKLVARNDISGLEVVEKALLHPAESHGYLRQELAGSLGGLKDPRSIPALKLLIETNDPHIVKGAAIALRQSGVSGAIEPLSRLLKNNDEQVRYYAVVGLGEITGQDEWTPDFEEFHGREGRYLSYWLSWAASSLPHQAPIQ